MPKKHDKEAHLTPEEVRGPLLAAVLNHVPFDGWGDVAMRRGADDIGISIGFAKLAYPGGAREMVATYLADANETLAAALDPDEMAAMKIRERIAHGVKTRLMQHAHQRPVIERTLGYLQLPQHLRIGAKAMWKMADIMWRAAGDTATDYNHYTKRAILSGVYSSTLLYWLQDDSDGFEKTWAFLDRRIENVMQFEKAKARAKGLGARIPNPAVILGRMRYPEGHMGPRD